jgi:uncharacterized protein
VAAVKGPESSRPCAPQLERSPEPAQALVRPGAATTAGEAAARPTVRSALRRGLLLTAGVLFVALALVGVVVPVLPTTPFLLLAAACFLRSSRRMHRWLLGNRLFGEYLRRYRDGEGMSVASKVKTLVLLWATLAASLFVALPADLWWARPAVLAVGLGVTVFIVRIKPRRH